MCNQSFFEVLENRQLLSAAPVLFDTPVARDRAAIRFELLKFKVDIFACGVKLDADYHRIHKHTSAGDTSLVAGFTKLHSDAKVLKADLLTDRLNEQTAGVKDEATIKLEIIQIKRDKGNANALAADHVLLTADRVQLQTDLLAGLDSRIATRQSFEATISTDTQNIVTAANGDNAASTALKDAVNKFADDRVTCLNKLTADLQTIATSRQKLANDLTAAQTT